MIESVINGSYQSKILLRRVHWLIRWSGNQWLGLCKPVNMFCLSLLSVGLNQVLNSVRSWKKSDYNAVKLSYELNFRHSRFISYLFTIHSQGLLHFTPHGIHVNHDSRNTFFFFYQITIHKPQKTGSRLHENALAAFPPPLRFTFCGITAKQTSTSCKNYTFPSLAVVYQ